MKGRSHGFIRAFKGDISQIAHVLHGVRFADAIGAVDRMRR